LTCIKGCLGDRRHIGVTAAIRQPKRAQAMIKDIVVNLTVDEGAHVVGDFAISVAELFESHLSAVAFAYEPPIGGSVFDGLTPAIIDTWRAERVQAAEKARDAFEQKAKRAGVACDSRVLSSSSPGAANIFSTIARSYDLSILPQSEPDDDIAETLAIEAALFDSGRPVLAVPYIHKTGLKLDRVVVCWDGSRSAARAVGDALPLLKRAKTIDVVTVEHKETRKELRGAQIAEHLARHKLRVELKPLVAPDSDAASVVLSYAADSSADLIVMGGYGHTRLREFVLGGMTYNILKSMTVPVLMSH
jgi:nucleotide-binding universal stress UspA family protein